MLNLKIRSKCIFTCILGSVLFLTGCHKNVDDIFDKTADQRLTESLAAYQKTLTQAPGWKVFIYPQGLKTQNIEVGGLTYYMKFTDSNRVSMVSDFTTDYADTPNESGYRLKAVQRPSIYFDTYSFIHVPADPSASISYSPTSANGSGWGTDFDFAFADNAPGDTIHLRGNFNRSEGVMIKARAGEMDSAFTRSRLGAIINNTNNYVAASSFLYLQTSGTQKAALGFDFNLVNVTFTYLDASGVVITIKSPFSYTTSGLFLKSALTIGGYTFQEMFWDDVKKIFYIISGTNRVEIANSATPILTFSLTGLLGSTYSTISVPVDPLPNQSALFTSRYNTAKAAIKAGAYRLDLSDMDFEFNAAAKTMSLYAYIYQGNAGFIALYNYTYTVDAAGFFKFTRISQNGNGANILTDMRNLLDFIDTDQFKIDGFATSSSVLGQFTSRERPAFFFTGYLY